MPVTAEIVTADFPFLLDVRGRTAETDPDDHVRDLLYQVLFTSPGERVNRPEFGCGLKQLVFMPSGDALATVTQQLVQGALHRWLETVISIERVEVSAVDSTLTVSVVYARLDIGERQQAVFEQALP